MLNLYVSMNVRSLAQMRYVQQTEELSKVSVFLAIVFYKELPPVEEILKRVSTMGENL